MRVVLSRLRLPNSTRDPAYLLMEARAVNGKRRTGGLRFARGDVKIERGHLSTLQMEIREPALTADKLPVGEVRMRRLCFDSGPLDLISDFSSKNVRFVAQFRRWPRGYRMTALANFLPLDQTLKLFTTDAAESVGAWQWERGLPILVSLR